MRYNRLRLCKSNLFGLFIFTNIISLFFACTKQQKHIGNANIIHQFQYIDSVVVAGDGSRTATLLQKIRHELKNTDPLIVEYYREKATNNRYNIPMMELYADSSLAFFNSRENQEKYKDEYFKALLVKGDACMLDKRYNLALRYYDQARSVSPNGSCENGVLATKIASIYYEQKNFGLAAKYWAINYKHLGECNPTESPQKLFLMRQGALNNTGFAFERGGQLDSAAHYYNEDLKIIEQADKENLFGKYYISTAKIVVYDNLGGLKLKQGNYKEAYGYLNLCLSIAANDVDGMRITPYMKLAELNLRTGKFKQAENAFLKSRQLLNHFYKENSEADIRWNKLYAEYLFAVHLPEQAYQHLNNYIRLNDSLESTNSKVYRLDVERELSTLQQQQIVNELKEQDKIKLIYMVAVTIVAVLLIVIIILVMRNLSKSRESYNATTLSNSQLKHTLTELENLNKNYIRMMRVMAHDLRNPLWGITGLATMLLDEEGASEDSRHALKLIESTGSNTMDMINELLKSGLDDENEPIAVEAIDIKKLLFDSVELLRFKAKEKKQEILFESDVLPVIAAVNQEKMWRVFNNVIVNAIKFSFEGGIIKVKMTVNDAFIQVSVADDGIGIPEKNRDSIFEMFTPNKRQGTNGEQPFGLGLSISKKIMEKHNGKIWFASKDGKGTIFYLQLHRKETI
jgi:signal transduction histidine kinase